MLDQAFELWDWLRNHRSVLWWSGAVSLVMFLGTLLVVPLLLVKIPEDYFTTPAGEDVEEMRGGNLALWLAFRIGKNLIGVLLVLMGVILLVLPGQGLLTILLGVTLLDLPGKRDLEVALLRRPSVHRAVNWLRRKSDRPPLALPGKVKSTD